MPNVVPASLPMADLPQIERWSKSGDYARDGNYSVSIDTLDYGDYVYLHGSLRAPPNPPPEPGSMDECTRKSMVFRHLTGAVTQMMRTFGGLYCREPAYELISLTATTATLRRIKR